MEWSPPAKSLGCRSWAQESPKLFSEGTETIRIGTTAAPVLRTSCCKDTTVISHQKKNFFFAFIGQGNLTLLLYVKDLAEVQPPSTVHSTRALQEQVRHSLTSRPHCPYFSIYWCFLQSSSFPFTVLGFFSLSVLLAEAASLWQELECKEVLQNPPACSLWNVQRASVCSWDSFHELATKHWKAPKKLPIVLWGAEGLRIGWLLTEEDRPTLCLPQRHSMHGLYNCQEGSRHVWDRMQT